MNRVCPNVRYENITLWSFSWRLKFIHSQFPLLMALNFVFSLLKCQTDLKFVYLFCQTDTFLFVIETPILFSGHPGISVNELSPLSLRRWNIRHFKFDFHRLKMADSLLLEEVTSPRKREYVNVNILLVGTSNCKTWNIKSEIYYWAQK